MSKWLKKLSVRMAKSFAYLGFLFVFCFAKKI